MSTTPANNPAARRATAPVRASAGKSRWKSGKFWGVLSAGAAILLGAMYYMAAVWPVLPAEKIAQPAVTYSKLPVESKFSISLEAPIDHPYGREVDVALVLANSGDSKITLKPFETGWPFQSGDCPALRIDNGQPKSELRVEPHSSVTYALRLVADCPSEAQPISLHYKADVAGNAANEVDGYIQTSPLIVVGEGRHTFGKFLTLLNGLLHLLLAPIVLAAFGWWLNNLISDRDAKLKNEQDARDLVLRKREMKRDRRLKEQQEARDRRNDVLKSLITNYRDLVFGDYLPIVRRMQAVEVEVPTTLRAPAAGPLSSPLTASDVSRLLCAILLFRARLLSFITQKGGIYFRSKVAERLFADLIGGFFSKVWAMLGKEPFEQAAQMLDPGDTLTAAKQRYANGIAAAPSIAEPVKQTAGSLVPEQIAELHLPATRHDDVNKMVYQENNSNYRELESRFLKWVNKEPAEFREYTRLLQIATELLEFECDRPFYQTGPLSEGSELQTSGWYFDPPVIELTKTMYEIPKVLRGKVEDDPATGEGGQRGLWLQLHEYWINLPHECKGSSPEPPK